MLNLIYHRSNWIFHIHDTIFATIEAFLFLMAALCGKLDFSENLLKEHFVKLRTLRTIPGINVRIDERDIEKTVSYLLVGGDLCWAEFVDLHRTDECCKQIIEKVKSLSEDQRKQIIGGIVHFVLGGDLVWKKISLVQLLLKDFSADLSMEQRDQVIRTILDKAHSWSVEVSFDDAYKWTMFLLMNRFLSVEEQREQVIRKIVDCFLGVDFSHPVFHDFFYLVELLLKDFSADLIIMNQRDPVIEKAVGYVLEGEDFSTGWAKLLLEKCYNDLSKKGQCKQIVGKIVDCILRGSPSLGHYPLGCWYLSSMRLLLQGCPAVDLSVEQRKQVIKKVVDHMPADRCFYIRWAELLLEKCYDDLSKEQRKQMIGEIIDYVMRTRDLFFEKTVLLLLKDCSADLYPGQRIGLTLLLNYYSYEFP
jgi:hypothetical protein